MMQVQNSDRNDAYVQVLNREGRGAVVVVCEHASAFVPPALKNLGLDEADRDSHAAWDPGAFGVAQNMAQRLGAVLVAGAVSRLVYDCNRPPDAPDAMPARSERIVVPGNATLDDAARKARTETYYAPFRAALAAEVGRRKAPVLVTVHSFTPVYYGKRRLLDIGLLHDSDSRLTDAMLENAAAHTDLKVERNAPYGPQDGVTHTLKEHAIPAGLPNVMIEIRNDLIATEEDQTAMAELLSRWVSAGIAQVQGAADA